MPTGYTAIIEERDVTFEEFVWRCARAMGALILMRDDPPNAEIPERFEPSDYHEKSIRDAEQRVAQLERMTAAERVAEGQRLKTATIDHDRDWLARERATNARFAAMEEKVSAWQPPTAEHHGFKDFMLQQLRISKSSTDYIERALASAETKAPGEFFADELSDARQRLASAREYYKEEMERVEARNRWLAQLRESVPYTRATQG